MMLRTQISLTEEDRSLLDAESARTGRSISALIRDAVMLAYGSHGDTSADLQALDEALGAWRDRDFTGADYVESVRSGSRLLRSLDR